jgi:hypothetical protein
VVDKWRHSQTQATLTGQVCVTRELGANKTFNNTGLLCRRRPGVLRVHHRTLCVYCTTTCQWACTTTIMLLRQAQGTAGAVLPDFLVALRPPALMSMPCAAGEVMSAGARAGVLSRGTGALRTSRAPPYHPRARAGRGEAHHGLFSSEARATIVAPGVPARTRTRRLIATPRRMQPRHHATSPGHCCGRRQTEPTKTWR